MRGGSRLEIYAVLEELVRYLVPPDWLLEEPGVLRPVDRFAKHALGYEMNRDESKQRVKGLFVQKMPFYQERRTIAGVCGPPGSGKSHALDLVAQVGNDLVRQGHLKKVLFIAITFGHKRDLNDVKRPALVHQQLSINILFSFFCGLQVDGEQYREFAEQISPFLPEFVDREHWDDIVWALEERFFGGADGDALEKKHDPDSSQKHETCPSMFSLSSSASLLKQAQIELYF